MNYFVRAFLFAMISVMIALGGAGCSAEAKKARRLAAAKRLLAAHSYDAAEIEYMNVLQTDHTNPEAILQLGLIYLEQGRLGRVFPFLVKARELQPDNLDVRIKVASIYAAAGRPKDARTEVLYVLEHRPKDPDAPILLAETFTTPEEMAETKKRLSSLPPDAPVLTAQAIVELRQRNPSGAQMLFEQAIAADPKSAGAHMGLGSFFAARGESARAEAEFTLAVANEPPRSSKRLQLARFKMQTGKIDAAKADLQAMLQQAPDYIPAWLLSAEISAGQKNYDEALAAIGKVLIRDDRHPEAMLLSGRVLLAKGETAKAIAELDRGITIHPQSAVLHHQLGIAYLAQGDIPKATASLNQAVTFAPQFAPAVLLLSEVNVRNGNAATAVSALRQLIQQQPGNTQAVLLLAVAFRAQGKLDSALAIYKQLAEANPKNPQAHSLIGFVLSEQKKRAEAKAAFSRALEIDPSFIPAVEQLVNFDVAAKDFASARRRIDVLLGRQPDNPQALLLLSRVFLAQPDLKQAEATLLKVIGLKPDLPLPYFLLGRLYAGSKEYEKAIDNLQQATVTNPKATEPLMVLAAVQDIQKDYKAARDTYEKLLKVNPRFGPALNNLAYLYSEQLNELDKAFEIAQRAREVMGHDPSTADTLGWILHKRGQYAWAGTLLAESEEKLPSSGEAQFHAGINYYMLGNESQARASLERALKTDPSFVGNGTAREALAVLDVSVPATAEGIRLLERSISARPDPVALTRLAATHEQSGATAKARTAYEAALKASPNNVTAALGLIRIYRKQDETAKALELAKATRKLAPTDPLVAHQVGRLAFETGDFSWAFSLLQETVAKDPKDPTALFDFALASYSQGNVPAATNALREALEANSGFPQAERARQVLDLVSLAADPKGTTEAKAKVDRALKADERDVPALMALGTIAEQSRNTNGAREAYEKALSRFPDFSPAQRRLAILYSQAKGDEAKGVVYATKARAAYPEDADLAKAFGILMYRQGNFSRAQSLLQESMRRLSTDGELMYYLGMAQKNLKDATASIKSLNRALELGLSAELASEAKRTLSTK